MALLAARSSVRSHLVSLLLVLVPVVVVAIPRMLEGDGTLTGAAQIVLRYSLAAVSFLLSTATVWASCLALAGEMEGQQIHLLAVKPVRSWEIWLGKWCGLFALNLVLLILTGVMMWLQLQWLIRRPGITDAERQDVQEEILTARASILPVPDVTPEDVDREIRRLIAAGDLAADIPHEAACAYAGRLLRVRRATVQPGHSRRWLVELPQPVLPRGREGTDAAFSVRFELALYAGDRQPVTGTFSVGEPGQPPFFRASIRRHLRGTYRFGVPIPRGVGEIRRLEIVFTNAERPLSHTAIFRPNRNLEVRVRQGSFEGNLLRALVVLLAYQGVLAALGLTAGTFLSFPVATFAVVGTITAVALVGTLGEEGTHHSGGCVHGEAHPPGRIARLAAGAARAVYRLAAPALHCDVLEPLSEGIAIPATHTAYAWAVLLGGYTTLLAGTGAWVLGRRELALAG